MDRGDARGHAEREHRVAAGDGGVLNWPELCWDSRIREAALLGILHPVVSFLRPTLIPRRSPRPCRAPFFSGTAEIRGGTGAEVGRRVSHQEPGKNRF